MKIMPTFKYNSKSRNKKSKRDSSDEVLSQALQVLKQPNPDDMDIFEQYTASELRKLKDPEIR